jgi:hypothetical protein
MAQRRAARVARLDGFDAVAFGPDPGDHAIERPQPPSDFAGCGAGKLLPNEIFRDHFNEGGIDRIAFDEM